MFGKKTKPVADPVSGAAPEFNAERVRLIYRLVPRSSFLTASVAAIAAAMLYGHIADVWLFLWFATAMLIVLGRYALYLAYRRSGTANTEPGKWENAFAFGALLMGCCWAVLPLLGPLPTELDFFVLVVIFSLAMSSAGILGASVRSFACFCTPMLVLQVGEMFVHGSALFVSMGIISLIFIFSLLSAYSEFRRALLTSIRSGTEIAELHRRQRRVFEAANVAVAMTVNRKVVDCNDKFAELFGYGRDELIGQSSRILYADDTSWLHAGEVGRAAMLAGQSARSELAYMHKSGATMICDSSVSSLVRHKPEHGVVAVLHDMTQFRRQERELRDALLRQTAIFENAPAGIILTRKRVVEECNEFMAKLLGRGREELIGRDAEKWFVSKERWEQRGAEIYDAFSRGKSYTYEEELIRKDGARFWCRVRGGMIDPSQPVDGPAVFVLIDVTERKLAESALARSQEQMQLVLNASQSGIWDMDMKSREISFSQHFYKMLGFKATSGPEAVNPVINRVHPDDRDRMSRSFYDHIRSREPIDEIFRLRCKDETYLWVRGHGQAVWNKAGRATRFVGSITDVSELKRQEEEIRKLALHDVLTGLPNRRLLEDRLEQSLSAAQRNRTLTAVMLLDLDGFKAVNDTRGHPAGDTVLCVVADRLKSSIRVSDTVARAGGDEFVILVDCVPGIEAVSALAEKVLGIIAEPIVIDGESVRIGGSIGISIYPQDAEHAAQLMRMADKAMYMVKESGCNGYRFFANRLGE